MLKELIRQKQKEYNLGVVEVYSAQNEELVRSSNPERPTKRVYQPVSEDIKGCMGEGTIASISWQSGPHSRNRTDLPT